MSADLSFGFAVSGKFKVLDQPYVLPCKCVGCGIGHNDEGRRQFIDTGLELDYFGVIYICTACFVEMANGLGYASPEQLQFITERAESKIENMDGLLIENDALRTAVNILSNHRCFSSPSDPEERINEQIEGTVSEEPPQIGGEEESDPPEHVELKRLPNVRRATKPNDTTGGVEVLGI